MDFIAGTSIGSIVGGFYATGVDVQTIDDVLSEVDWNDVLDDRTTFRELSFRRKDDGRRYLTNLHAGLKKWRVVLPRGLLSGQKLNFPIRAHSLPESATGQFTDFPMRIGLRRCEHDLRTAVSALRPGRGRAEAFHVTIGQSF